MAKRPGDDKDKESIKRPKIENEADEEGSELRRLQEMFQKRLEEERELAQEKERELRRQLELAQEKEGELRRQLELAHGKLEEERELAREKEGELRRQLKLVERKSFLQSLSDSYQLYTFEKMMAEIAELSYRLTGYEELVGTLGYNRVEKSVVGSSLQTPNPDNTIHCSKFKRNFLANPDNYPFQKIHVKHDRMIEVVCSTLFKTDHNQMNSKNY
jgi:hypothetical protein